MRWLATQQAPAKPQLSPEAQALLDQLRDVHAPAAPSWWPPAPGWWLLALLLLALIGASLFWLHKWRRRRAQNRYRAEGIRLLEKLDVGAPGAAQHANEILKRVAVTTYGRRACGNLTGRAWLDFLRQTSPAECPAPAEKVLLEQLYRSERADAADLEALRDYAAQWIKTHEKQPGTKVTRTPEAASV